MEEGRAGWWSPRTGQAKECKGPELWCAAAFSTVSLSSTGRGHFWPHT